MLNILVHHVTGRRQKVPYTFAVGLARKQALLVLVGNTSRTSVVAMPSTLDGPRFESR